VLLHADYFTSRLPPSVNARALAQVSPILLLTSIPVPNPPTAATALPLPHTFLNRFQVGFFIDAPSLYGDRTMSDVFSNVCDMHNVTASSSRINAACFASLPPSLRSQCFFAQRSLQHISTPIYILNSRNDNWQIQNIAFAEQQPPCTWQHVNLPRLAFPLHCACCVS